VGYGIREDMLTTLLLERGITQQEFAKQAGVSGGTITNAVRGSCRLKTIQGLLQRAKVPNWPMYLRTEDKVRLDGPKLPRGAGLVPLCMLHRTRPKLRDEYYRAALTSGHRVLYISVMSRHSFKLLEKYLANHTQLQVLTWNPASIEEIAAYAKHLQEEDDKIKQTQGALERWAELEKARPNIDVRTYASSPPMLQGVIVENKWAMLEVIPYSKGPSRRPAILLRKGVQAERPGFEFFAEVFQKLFDDSKGRKPNVRPTWFRSDPVATDYFE
jgi:transcriptional regulator with XRE-family HTH domain